MQVGCAISGARAVTRRRQTTGERAAVTRDTDNSDTTAPRHYRRGVARGLTVSFALLAMLPMAGGIYGWLSTRAVKEPLQRVVAVTEGFGVEDRAFRGRSRELVNLFFIQDGSFESREAFDVSAARVRDALAQMRDNIERIAANSFIAGGDELLERQEFTETALSGTLATAERRISLEERQAGLVRDISDAEQRIADRAALARAAGSAAEMQADTARRLDALTYSASTLSMLAREGSRLRDTAELSSLRADFAARMRTALNELANLPERPYRADLGVQLEAVFDLALASGGLFDTVRDALALRRVEREQREAIRRYVTQTVLQLGRIARDNDAQVAASLQSAQASLTGADIRMLAVGGVSTALVLLILLLYVQRNVLRRLDGLTHVTHTLTRGGLEQRVRIEGNDELSELAAALEAFREQALQLRQKERELAARTDELEHVNAELDQFAYVASHDLKAPMRAIDSLAGFLQEDLGDAVDASSRRHLDMLQGRVRRLSRLLDALLEYSRAGRHRTPPETVDLRELVEASAELVMPQGGRIEYRGDFGTATVSRTPLEQVVRNVVDNAFKHNDDAHGAVTIDCGVEDGMVRIVIADNGPGIDPQYHDKIFGMFQTLRPRDEVEGSGMGLAILKKLADNYGGTIDVDSNPAEARGARFIIRWPVGSHATMASAGKHASQA